MNIILIYEHYFITGTLFQYEHIFNIGALFYYMNIISLFEHYFNI